MRIDTETTSLLLTTPSGDSDDSKGNQLDTENNVVRLYYYHYPSNVERNVVAAKVISYSAVALTLLLAVVATVTTVLNGTKYIKGMILFPTDTNVKQSNDLWFGHHQSSSSSSWWDSPKDFFKTKWFHPNDDEDDKKDDWDHHKNSWINNDSNWNKNWNTTSHTYEHSSSYEFHHEKNGNNNDTRESHEYETWTERYDNGTVTHYERWIDNNGTPHIKSWTSSG